MIKIINLFILILINLDKNIIKKSSLGIGDWVKSQIHIYHYLDIKNILYLINK